MCKLEGCTNKHYAKGLCKRHYSQMNKKSIRERVKNGTFKNYRTCDIEGCNRKHEARGLCNMHYLSYLKMRKIIASGRVLLLVRNRNKGCSAPTCKDKHHAKSYCLKHYTMSKRLGREITLEDMENRNKAKEKKKCEVSSCDNIAKIKGLCYSHNYRKSRGIDLNLPIGSVPRKEYMDSTK